MRKFNKYIFLLLPLIITLGCDSENTVLPKPRMYPRIFYPVKSYIEYNTQNCSFTFNYPTYSSIVKDSLKREFDGNNQCWFDIKIKDLNTSIYCSYYTINNQNTLGNLINDAFKIASEHNIKANYRKETILSNKYGIEGLMFEISGPVASPLQFYITDKKQHFFRGALYFDAKVNPDSTLPVLNFVRPDLDSLIASFQWKN